MAQSSVLCLLVWNVRGFKAQASCPMLLTFQEGKTIAGKTIQKQWQKNEGQKYASWFSSKNAHPRAAKNLYIFLPSIFLSYLSSKVSDIGLEACATG